MRLTHAIYFMSSARPDLALCALMPNLCKLLRLTVIFILFDSFIGCAHTLVLYACDGLEKCGARTKHYYDWHRFRSISCSGDSESSHNGVICKAIDCIWKKGNELNDACNCESFFRQWCLVFTFSKWIELCCHTFFPWILPLAKYWFSIFYCSTFGTIASVVLSRVTFGAFLLFFVSVWVEIKQTTIQMKSKFSHILLLFSHFLSQFWVLLHLHLCFVFSSRFGTFAQKSSTGRSNSSTTSGWNGTVNIRNGNS